MSRSVTLWDVYDVQIKQVYVLNPNPIKELFSEIATCFATAPQGSKVQGVC